MILENIGQYLVEDNENQTAYLKLPENNYWWYWYGSEYEAQAYYLKLLAATDAKSEKAFAPLAKYLLNNRRHAQPVLEQHATDTAIYVEAMAEISRRQRRGARRDTEVSIVVLERKGREVRSRSMSSNLLTFDKQKWSSATARTSPAASTPSRVTTRGHPAQLYFNAIVTNFTLEGPLAESRTHVEVERSACNTTSRWKRKSRSRASTAKVRSRRNGREVQAQKRSPNLSDS